MLFTACSHGDHCGGRSGGGSGGTAAAGSQSSDSFDMDAVTGMELIPQSDMTVTLTMDKNDTVWYAYYDILEISNRAE